MYLDAVSEIWCIFIVRLFDILNIRIQSFMEASLWNNNTRVNDINASESLKVPMSSLRIISSCKLDVSFSIIRLQIPLSGYSLVWHIALLFLVDSYFSRASREMARTANSGDALKRFVRLYGYRFFLLAMSISKRQLPHQIMLWNFPEVNAYTEIINVLTERFLGHCLIYFILFNLLNICNFPGRQKFNQELKKYGPFQ